MRLLRPLFLLTLAASIDSPVLAQTEGRLSVGGSITINHTNDSEVGTAITPGPLVRLTPRRGWRVAGAFNWFTADLDNPAGGDASFATLRVRPLMAGVSYTVGPDRLLTSFSIVGGPSFNRARFDDDFAAATQSAIDAENSIAIRPGVAVTWTLKPRVGIVGFGGYLINRPDTVYRNAAGVETVNRWKADALVLSVGAVYSLF